MTEEERKAFEKLNSISILLRAKFKKEYILKVSDSCWIEKILDLVEKLQEENKELKDKKTLVHIDEKGNIEPISGKYIPIEDLEEVIESRAFDIKDYLTVIDVNDLKELLKEE